MTNRIERNEHGYIDQEEDARADADARGNALLWPRAVYEVTEPTTGEVLGYEWAEPGSALPNLVRVPYVSEQSGPGRPWVPLCRICDDWRDGYHPASDDCVGDLEDFFAAESVNA